MVVFRPAKAALLLGCCLLLLAGCTALPGDMGSLVPVPVEPVSVEPDPDAAATPRHDAMFPTLTFNEDLLAPLTPTNRRDWAPELAVLARADFSGHR